jgi:hypothetical protein
VVQEVWEQRNHDQKHLAELAQRKVGELKDRKQKLVDFLLRGATNQATYQEQIERVGTELAVAEAGLSEQNIPEEEVSVLLEFAEWMLDRVAGIWNSASYENKLRIQTALFPSGVAASRAGFGTTERPLFFNQFGLRVCPRCWRRASV